MELSSTLRIQNSTSGSLFALAQRLPLSIETGKNLADAVETFRGSDPGLARQLEEAKNNFESARHLKGTLEKNTYIIMGSDCIFGLGTAILSSIFHPSGPVFLAAAAIFIGGIPAIFLCLNKLDKLKDELKEKEAMVKDLQQKKDQREEVAELARTVADAPGGEAPAIEQIEDEYVEIDGVRLKTHQHILTGILSKHK